MSDLALKDGKGRARDDCLSEVWRRQLTTRNPNWFFVGAISKKIMFNPCCAVLQQKSKISANKDPANSPSQALGPKPQTLNPNPKIADNGSGSAPLNCLPERTL